MMAFDYLRSALPLLEHFGFRPRLSTPAARRPPLGRVDLVGAGPGDPELITRKGWKALLQADVIVYDALVSPALLNEIPAIIRRIHVGKQKGRHSVSQPQICALLVELARAGQRVVRLKGGDPLVFGRLTEEMDALKAAGIPFTIVPGITAAAGCAASCQLPLTERGIAPRLRLITAHSCDDRPIDWADLARDDETLVFYMGLSMAATISTRLQQQGLPGDWPVLLVERGTHADQRAIRASLADMCTLIEHHALKSPTLILIGRVVEHYQALPVTELERTLLAAHS